MRAGAAGPAGQSLHGTLAPVEELGEGPRLPVSREGHERQEVPCPHWPASRKGHSPSYVRLCGRAQRPSQAWAGCAHPLGPSPRPAQDYGLLP